MRSMFHTAQVAVIDANVADGSLTDEQAATLKQRLADAIARRAEAQANHGAINELWQKTLSEKLGLSIEEMQSLFGETRDEVIQQAMEQGLLTEEQARQWLENHDSGMPFFGGRRNRQMPGGMGRPGADDSNLRGMPFGDTEF
jgi:polyhydroxyalkanoate synthesis regulator phasin